MRRWHVTYKLKWPGGQVTTETEVFRTVDLELTAEAVSTMLGYQHGSGSITVKEIEEKKT